MTKQVRSMTLIFCTIVIFNLLLCPPVTKAVESGEYYKMKLIVKSNSDWTKVEPLPPWDEDWRVTEYTIIKPTRDRDKIKLDKLYILGESGNDTYKEIEYTVYFKAQAEDLKFLVTKGAIGTTTVEAYNTCSEKQYRIGKYTTDSSPDNPSDAVDKFKMPIEKISKYGTVPHPRN